MELGGPLTLPIAEGVQADFTGRVGAISYNSLFADLVAGGTVGLRWHIPRRTKLQWTIGGGIAVAPYGGGYVGFGVAQTKRPARVLADVLAGPASSMGSSGGCTRTQGNETWGLVSAGARLAIRLGTRDEIRSTP